MSLTSAIQQLGLTGQPSANIVTAFGVEVEVSRDATPYRWAGVIKRLLNAGVGEEVIAVWDKSLEAVEGGSLIAKMLDSDGIDLTNPDIRKIIIATGVKADPDLANLLAVLLSIGITSGPQWQASGLDALPTVEEVDAALNSLATNEWAQGMWAGIVQPMLQDGSTIDEIKSAISKA